MSGATVSTIPSRSLSKHILVSIEQKKIEINEFQELEDARTSFNFILKESTKGVIYMGSQIDTFFYILYRDEHGNQVSKKIELRT